jgi:hypothetical protein
VAGLPVAQQCRIEQHRQALSDWRDKNNNDEKETNG